MNWELIGVLSGLMFFSYWLNYVMGGPLSDDTKRVDVRAILFAIPNALAIRRLRRLHIYSDLVADWYQQIQMTKDLKLMHQLKQDGRLDIYLAGREFFTWERSLLCPVCFHWWITLLVGVVLLCFDLLNARADFFLAVFAYLVNHFLIRKIS